jgi:hypothetical protein
MVESRCQLWWNYLPLTRYLLLLNVNNSSMHSVVVLINQFSFQYHRVILICVYIYSILLLLSMSNVNFIFCRKGDDEYFFSFVARRWYMDFCLPSVATQWINVVVLKNSSNISILMFYVRFYCNVNNRNVCALNLFFFSKT